MIDCMMQNFAIELFLDIAPPNMARMFGYKGSWRWLAFYWSSVPEGGCIPRHFDGHSYGAADIYAWDAFFNHRLILAHNHRREDGHAIKRFDFGNEYTVATHWLLLDRFNRRLYAGPEVEVAQFVNIFMEQKSSLNEDHSRQSSNLAGKGRDASTDSRSDRTDISQMTAWLDERLAMIEKSGKWPIYGK